MRFSGHASDAPGCARTCQLVEHETGGARTGVVAPGVGLQKLAGDFDFTEGPTCDAAGNVFFTDQPNNRILKWSVEGRLSTFLQPAGRANGMYFDRAGHLIACADEKNELWSIAPDGGVTVLAGEYEGKSLNGPNDVWVRPDGAIYSPIPSTSGRGGRTTRCRRTASTSTVYPPIADGSCA
jgi:sugar lactone lactonase YvrE